MTTSGCQQFRQTHHNRRELLSIGLGTGLGLSWGELLRARENQSSRSRTFGAAKQIIFLFLHGGHPQHETWDPKPKAPANIRGEFGEIATSVPGLRISELLPRCAKIADRLTIIRSMSHDNPNHVQACLPAMTGHKHPASVRGRGDFPPSPNNFPHFGAVRDHVQNRTHDLPNWVQIGPEMTRSNRTVLHGQSPGFLGRKHGPMMVDQDLTVDNVRIQAIASRISISRLQGRQRLLAEVDAQRRIIDHRSANLKDAFYRRAFGLLTSAKTRQAFDLSSEPEKVRRRYPKSQVGQSCLLARRLVEAGVPFVNVHYCKTPRGSWDTHSRNFVKMKKSLAPTLDQAFSALVEELEERGLRDRVLVVPMGEFGRTPKINRNAGRDHWPWVYSLAMAGAGLQPGAVFGASDRLAAYPKSHPRDPADMAATLYHLMGIPSSTVLHDSIGRPHQLIAGRPIHELLA